MGVRLRDLVPRNPAEVVSGLIGLGWALAGSADSIRWEIDAKLARREERRRQREYDARRART